ncbi:MAG: hypothetical protein IJ545_00800 [Alphaproteobacteria bacterium]|nr:hypothetical protein [Alphaproteobacteria bacterium]
MKTIGYIFKKTLSLAIMAMFTCLLWGENAWSGECTNKIIYIGDSRTVGMYIAKYGTGDVRKAQLRKTKVQADTVTTEKDGNYWYAQSGAMLDWLTNGVGNINNKLSSHDTIVIALGANNTGCTVADAQAQAKKYISAINKYGGEWASKGKKVYWSLVTKVDEQKQSPRDANGKLKNGNLCVITNEAVAAFNSAVKAGLSSNISIINATAKATTTASDGIHYGSSVNKNIYEEIHNQACAGGAGSLTEDAAASSDASGVGSNNAVNPYLKEKKDCSSMSGTEKEQCEIRNKAIDEGGTYCKPIENSKTDSAKNQCVITKTATGSTTGNKACGGKYAAGSITSDITNAIADASKKYNIPAVVLAAYIQVESAGSWNPQVQACLGDGGGGLVQFQPTTWAQYALSGTHQVWEPDHYKKVDGQWVVSVPGHYVTVKGSGKCTGKNGRALTENDRFDAYSNIMCAAVLLIDNMKNTDGSLACGILAHNRGAGEAKSYKKSTGNCTSARYYKEISSAMQNLAKQNNCSLDALGIGGNCEYFSYGSGDSFGGGADDTNATLTQYFSNYKCSLSENFNQIQGCLFCSQFRVIFNAASQIAKVCHEKFASSLIKLMAVGLAISLAWIIMQYVSDMTQKDPGIMLNAIFRKIFVVVVIIALLKLDVAAFFNMFVTPVFDTGFKIAELAITNTGVDLPDGAGTVDGSGLPAKMGISMLKGIYAVQNRLEKLMALGSNSICIAFFVKSYHGYPIFPHFGYLLTGVFMWITATIFMAIYPFLLIDSVLQFTVASSLFPAALAASAFELTKKYLNIFKIIHIFINAMFIFIFITIIMFILLAGIDNSLLPIIQRAYDTSDNDYFNLDNFIWYSKEFVKLIFFLFLGKAVLEDIPSFAEDFAKPLSMGESGAKNLGIGRSVGGTAARAATGIAKGGAEIAWKATKSTGGTALAGAALAGSTAMADIRSLRHNYLMNRTQKKLDKANAEAAASGRGPVTSVTGRNFWGQKVTRSIVKNPDGTMALQSTRKSLIRRREVSVLADENMSIKQKISKNGAIRESYKMDKSIARSLINKDGTINQKAINKLMQNSSLPKDAVNKAILNQLMQQRLPNAGRKIGFKWGWPPVTVNRGASLSGGLGSTGAFVSEKINSYTDDKGREVFEVRRVGLDGNTSVYRMVKGESRAMVEYERITKNGHSHKWSSDGIIQKKESGRYDSGASAPQQQDAPAQVTVNGAEMKGMTIGSDGSVTDKDGNFVGMMNASGNIIDKQGNAIGTGKSADLVFDQNGKALGKIKAVNNYAYRTEAGTYNIKGHICDANGAPNAVITEDGQIINYTDKGSVLGQLNEDQKTYLGKSVDNLNRSGYRAQKVEFSHARAYKGAKIFDDDGIIEDAFKDEELMFDDSDLELYKQQMKKYGDVINHHAFGR